MKKETKKEIKRTPEQPTQDVTTKNPEELQKDAEKAYETRFKELMIPLYKHLDSNEIKLSAIVIIDPKTNQPMLAYRGEILEAAKLSKWLFEQFRRQIAETLSIDE
jgi:hypothetical protein